MEGRARRRQPGGVQSEEGGGSVPDLRRSDGCRRGRGRAVWRDSRRRDQSGPGSRGSIYLRRRREESGSGSRARGLRRRESGSGSVFGVRVGVGPSPFLFLT